MTTKHNQFALEFETNLCCKLFMQRNMVSGVAHPVRDGAALILVLTRGVFLVHCSVRPIIALYPKKTRAY
jgi:hypothetical protein